MSDDDSIFSLLGKVNNLDDPVPTLNERPAVLGVTISFLVLAWLCGGFRLYIRLFVARCPGWDDFFVGLVMISIVIGAVGVILALNHGLGKHFILLPFGQQAEFIKAFYLANAAYPLSTAFIKLALLFQYLRIFEKGTILRYITISVIIITALWGLAYSFIAWVPCIPVAAYWDWTIVATARYGFGSHNADIFAKTYESHVGINAGLDFIVFALPIPLFFQPNLRGRSRVGLFCLVLMGALVVVLSIWRLASLTMSRAGTYPTLDPSWYGCAPIVLAALEVDLATICASLPVFWPVLEKNMGMIFVTREVKVTRETRRFSTLDDESELYTLPPVSPGEVNNKESFVRYHADPLRKSKATKTEVKAGVEVNLAERKQSNDSLKS